MDTLKIVLFKNSILLILEKFLVWTIPVNVFSIIFQNISLTNVGSMAHITFLTIYKQLYNI
jgi:hypothetical protein